MVSTRSGKTSTKHEVPTPEKDAPAKKQRTSQEAAKPIEANGKVEEKRDEKKDLTEQKIEDGNIAEKESEKTEAPKLKEKRAEPSKDTPAVNDTENNNGLVPKPPVPGSQATKAVEQTTGGAKRDTLEEAGFPPPLYHTRSNRNSDPQSSRRVSFISFSAHA
jgi:hypothetical protein